MTTPGHTSPPRPSTAAFALRAAGVGVIVGIVLLGLSVWEFAAITGDNKASRSIIIELFTSPSALWGQVAGFVSAVLLIHAVATMGLALLMRPAAEQVLGARGETRSGLLLLLLMALLLAFLWNARRFPGSGFAFGMETFAAGALGTATIALLGVTLGTAVFFGLVVHAQGALRDPARRRPLAALVASLAILGLVALVGLEPSHDTERRTGHAHPHVVLVGIDGWRLDTAPLTGGPPGLMPFLDSLFAQAAVLEESYTPLARTYPSWMTILTGQMPVEHGARFNLVEDADTRRETTLPRILRRAGYHSIFAMDERRFARIGAHHGFDVQVGPPHGAGDFLLGKLGDTPLTNLVVNGPVGRRLLPFSHGNRAVHATYLPETFDHQLRDAIASAPRAPLFLAVHYELPHWPYTWGERPDSTFQDVGPQGPGEYLATLARVDRQVRDLFGYLEESGVIDHAIVVVLSDHGEVFDPGGVAWQDPGSGESLGATVGHGTSVLALDQYRVPLAFLRTGVEALEPGIRPLRGSLADVLPTVLAWLGMSPPTSISGMSLAEELVEPTSRTWDRALPLETGIHLDAMDAVGFQEAALLDEGVAYYRVNREGHLVLRDDRLPELLRRKERAVLMGDHLLASLPPRRLPGEERMFEASPSSRAFSWLPVAEGGSGLGEPTTLAAFCRLFAPDRAATILRPCPDPEVEAMADSGAAGDLPR
jgi:arylsulfatase A-like enzyme